MKDTELIQTALMLTPPWQVAECQFDINQERLNIHLDFLKGSQFSCPACDQADCAVHDTKEKSWRHLNFFQHPRVSLNLRHAKLEELSRLSTQVRPFSVMTSKKTAPRCLQWVNLLKYDGRRVRDYTMAQIQ